MMDDEQQIDSYLAQTAEPQTEVLSNREPTDEEVVEKKARENTKPTPQTIRQRRTVLSEQQLEDRILATVRKYPLIDEIELRERVSAYLEEIDEITEGAYARIVDRLLKEQEKAEKEGQPAKSAQQKRAFSPDLALQNGVRAAQDKATRVADWAGSLATPGGVGFLVAVLLFFVWLIVPVSNGKTRMQLLWGVLTGQTEFRAVEGAGADTSTEGGAGTSFSGDGGDIANSTAIMPMTPYIPNFDVDEW